MSHSAWSMPEIAEPSTGPAAIEASDIHELVKVLDLHRVAADDEVLAGP